MKSIYLFSALASGLMMLSACSSEDVLISGGELADETLQQLILQVEDAGDGTGTRAGRPLYSSEAKQAIDKVKVIICDNDDNVVRVDSVTNWNTNSTVCTTGGHGRKATITIPTNEKLAPGTYTVYAIGHHTTSDYELTHVTGICKGSKFTEDLAIKLKDKDGSTSVAEDTFAATSVGEEIFAGSLRFDVTDGAVGFNHPVVLHRQVAGTFGYFEGIPYVAGAARLELVASSLNTQLILGNFRTTELANNGDGNAAYYTVNGAGNKTKNTIVYSIDLKKWLGDVKDADNDGIIDTGAWQIPTEYKGKANFKDGSVFGGGFVIPFAKATATTTDTFELQLVDAAGNALKKWTVKLPESDKQISAHKLYSWNGTSFVEKTNVTDLVNNYNVLRNHLYGIGERTIDNPTDPGNPNPGTGDPDEPESLDKKHELTMHVNDNWAVIHKMDVTEKSIN